MTISGKFDHFTQDAHSWLREIEKEAALATQDQAYSLLRATLHVIRDRLPAIEAVQLGSQLPTLIRGVYYEGWQLADRPPFHRSMIGFVEDVMAAMAPASLMHPTNGVCAVLALLGRHVPSGEIEDVRRCLPEDIRSHWPEAVDG